MKREIQKKYKRDLREILKKYKRDSREIQEGLKKPMKSYLAKTKQETMISDMSK